LNGEPGSPEFIASYHKAIAQKIELAPGALLKLVRDYEETSEFDGLAPRTKRDYRQKLALIEKEFGDFLIAAPSDPGARGVFKDWRDKLAKRSKRQADYAWVVLARALSVAKDRGKISVNPCEKGGRLYAGSRRDKIWTLEGKARSWKRPQLTWVWRFCSPFGLGSAKAICCGCRGPDMTARGFA
jgi:hypothetical protein